MNQFFQVKHERVWHHGCVANVDEVFDDKPHRDHGK